MTPTSNTENTPKDHCALCLDSGFTYDDKGQMRSCRCRIRRNVGLYLASNGVGDVAPAHGLLDKMEGRLRPKSGHMVIRCGWDTFQGHLAGWLICQYAKHMASVERPRVLTLTDTQIRNMWFGQQPDGTEAKTSQLFQVGQYDVSIVHVLGIRHSATATALHEALATAKQLWLVSHVPFEAGHPAWSEDLGHALETFRAKHLDLSDGETTPAAESWVL